MRACPGAGGQGDRFGVEGQRHGWQGLLLGFFRTVNDGHGAIGAAPGTNVMMASQISSATMNGRHARIARWNGVSVTRAAVNTRIASGGVSAPMHRFHQHHAEMHRVDMSET